MGTTYTLISQTTLSSPSSLITFSSIPSTYTDLVLVYNGKVDYTNFYSVITFNGDTTKTNYQYNAAVMATSVVSDVGAYAGYGFTASTTVPSVMVMDINNYASTTSQKTAMSRFSNTTSQAQITNATWRNTAAITQIDLFSYYGAGAYSTGSVFSLYGIKAA
jgi:hypothetical protein